MATVLIKIMTPCHDINIISRKLLFSNLLDIDTIVSMSSKLENKNSIDIIFKYWEIIDFKEFS